MTQKPAPVKAIAYLRVSSRNQKLDGLGIESQRKTVRDYCERAGLEIIATYTEQESGRKRTRKELQRAIQQSQQDNARLIVAALDRLARDAGFLYQLRDAGVDFVCCDYPQLSPLMLGVLGAIAEDTAARIRGNIRNALAAAKRRGTRLGRPGNMSPEQRKLGAAARRDSARDAYRAVANYAALMRRNGMTLSAIAAQLTADGHRTVQGRAFHPMTVARILSRVS